ncbi:MAG: ankyrin repeat domain-containing protein, partial [Parachlamydiaceae bacterium]|nr:ankyrin repeat domain-containing protein [Parachlamydiaceae bacterium]
PNLFDSKGLTPLMHAIELNKPEIVSILIENGANSNFTNPNGWIPLTYAIYQNKTEIVRLLMEFGANPNFIDPNNWTPVTYAINQDKIECVKVLLENGANPNFFDSKWTPLTFAFEQSNYEIAKFLLDNGADPDFFDSLWTPLTYAIELDNQRFIDILNEKGVDVDLHDDKGENPLASAIKNGKTQIAQQLIAADADIFYAEEYILMKFVGHVLGIKGEFFLKDRYGESHTVKLEGFEATIIVQKLCRLLKSFFSDTIYGNEIIQAFENCYPNQPLQVLFELINEGQPGICLGGTKNHSIGFVVFQDKLCMCNRGLGSTKDAVEFFELPPEKLTFYLLEILSKEYKDIQSFKNSFEELHLKKMGGYTQKKQTIANCAWATPKSIVGVLLREYLKDDIGKITYKEFANFCRESVREEYINYSRARNPDFLNAITQKNEEKIKRKINPHVLTNIIESKTVN